MFGISTSDFLTPFNPTYVLQMPPLRGLVVKANVFYTDTIPTGFKRFSRIQEI